MKMVALTQNPLALIVNPGGHRLGAPPPAGVEAGKLVGGALTL